MENADRIIGRLKAQGRQVMTEYESKKMLKDYGVPVAKSKVVTSVKDAIATAQKTGFPVVVKGHGARLARQGHRDDAA